MAVPTSETDRTAIGRGSSRTNSRSPARAASPRAAPNQIRDCRIGDRGAVARWLNIGCGYRRVIGNFLLKIADRNVERAAGQQISRSIVIARLGKLPVRGSAGEIRQTAPRQ